MENNIISIYRLIDPRDGKVKYVGWTSKKLRTRLINHLSDARRGLKSYRCHWLRKLMKLNIYPIIELIESVSYESRNEREMYWIKHYGRENLVNATDGGEGNKGLIVSDKTRKKLSESHKGQRAWNKGIPTSTKHLKNFQFKKGEIPFNKGQKMSKELRQKVSNSKKGVQIGKKRKSLSKFLGVTKNKKSEKWIAQIKTNKTYCIGKYYEEHHAAIAYDVFSLCFSFDRKILNFPEKRERYISYIKKDNFENIQEIRNIIKYFINQEEK